MIQNQFWDALGDYLRDFLNETWMLKYVKSLCNPRKMILLYFSFTKWIISWWVTWNTCFIVECFEYNCLYTENILKMDSESELMFRYCTIIWENWVHLFFYDFSGSFEKYDMKFRVWQRDFWCGSSSGLDINIITKTFRTWGK